MSKKKRKWSDEYVQYGFTCIAELDGIQRPKCMICNAKLSNSSLAPAKLKEHFKKLHGDGKYKNATLAEFKVKRARFDEKATLPALDFVPIDKSVLTASYEVAHLIAKQGQPHTIGETLVKPAALKMASIMLGKDAENKLSQIPLSNDTVSSRIDDMSNDIFAQVGSINSTTKQDGKTNQATEQRDSDCRQGPSESSSSIAQSSDSQDIKTEKNEEIYPFVNEGLIPYSTEYLDYNCSSIKQEEDLCSVKSEPLEESEFIPDDQGGSTSAAQPMESSFFQRESSSTLFPAESLSSSMSHQQGETQKNSFSVRKEDRFDHFGKNIAAKLRTLPKDQYIFAEKIITDVIFEAELGNLSRNSIFLKNSKMIHTDTHSLQPERIDRC